jgi:hypothetical protein
LAQASSGRSLVDQWISPTDSTLKWSVQQTLFNAGKDWLAGRGTELAIKRKKKRKSSGQSRGHYCWSCQQKLANENFSGRGHTRHLCKSCKQLGKEELEFRSELNNLERCMTWEGIVPRKRRKTFNRFLNSENPRILAVAEAMAEEDRRERQLMNELLNEKD